MIIMAIFLIAEVCNPAECPSQEEWKRKHGACMQRNITEL
jgi:hypothetical protein